MDGASIAGMFDLSGKVALITGGAVGMGKASGLTLANAGAAITHPIPGTASGQC